MARKPFKSKKPPLRPMGRPSKYKPEFCDLLVDHMKKGLSFESFAGLDEVDVDVDTLYEWAKTHPDFSEAKGRGFSKRRLNLEKTGLEGQWNESESTFNVGSSSRSFNAAVWKFQMVNACGWTDVSKVELSAPKPIPLAYQPKSQRKKEDE